MKVGDWKPCCVFGILQKVLAYEINNMDNSSPIKGAENNQVNKPKEKLITEQ